MVEREIKYECHECGMECTLNFNDDFPHEFGGEWRWLHWENRCVFDSDLIAKWQAARPGGE